MKRSRGRRVVPGALLALAAVAGCAGSPEPEGSAAGKAADLGGDWPRCYYFERNEGARTLNLPWGIRLSRDTLGRGWLITAQREEVRAAETLTGSGTQDHPFGYWWEVPGTDSLEIGYPGGGGIVLDVLWLDSRLEGTAMDAGDVVQPGEFGTPRSKYEITAVWAQCP